MQFDENKSCIMPVLGGWRACFWEEERMGDSPICGFLNGREKFKDAKDAKDAKFL
jgi:hypothetical protein